jgi:hypothetical protein
MRKLNGLYALALAPLLMGAGSTSSALKVEKFPTCNEDQYLVYRGGTLACETVAAGASIALPNCNAKGELLTRKAGSGDVGSGLTCAPKGQSGGAIDTTLLVNLETKITNLTTIVNNIKTGTGGPAPTYLGNSTATTKGNFLKAGDDNSIVSAAKLCEATFPGKSAHMCTVQEIYDSVVQGKITSAMTIPKAWVYFTSVKNSLAGATDPNYSFGNNCAGYNYPTADQKWTGVAFSTAKIAYNNQWAVRFHNGLDATTGAPCNVALPVACCGQ